MTAAVEASLDLYDAGEYVLAARRFEEAGRGAHELGDEDLERRATTAECLSWLEARRLGALGECTRRLEQLQLEARVPHPAVNTLVALGAIAEGRPLPPLKLPNDVRPLIQASLDAYDEE